MTVGIDVGDLAADLVSQRALDWVRPDEGRVSHRTYCDPDLFEAEIERIWKRTWLWAGHESEIPQPGDFVARTVGTVPIIISRTTDGGVAVNLNVCAHRGNQVCHLETGNGLIFKCPYHGWSYKNSGELAGVPYPKSYSDISAIKKLRLASPARVADYRGLIFISYSDDVPSLEDHLGTIRPELDRIFALSPVGKLRFDVGYNSIRLDCNWKVFQENGSDNYHGNFTHISAFVSDWQRRAHAAISNDESLAVVRVHDTGHTELDFRDQERALGVVMRTGNASAPDQDHERHIRLLADAVGETEARRRFDDSPPLLYIYPSLLLIHQDLRRVEPVSPTESLLFQHPHMLEGVPESINAQRLSRHEAAYGPAGFVLTDDMEIWGRVQRSINANPDGWTNLSRGIGREEVRADGVTVSQVTDETGARGAWRQYLKFMTVPQAPTLLNGTA